MSLLNLFTLIQEMKELKLQDKKKQNFNYSISLA